MGVIEILSSRREYTKLQASKISGLGIGQVITARDGLAVDINKTSIQNTDGKKETNRERKLREGYKLVNGKFVHPDGSNCNQCCQCSGGTRETTACTTTTNRVCTSNTCSCSNGAAVTGSSCTTNGANICSSCSDGSKFSTFFPSLLPTLPP